MIRKIRIRVYGIVQGVGFRPFVSRIADQNRIQGNVCNKGPYVEIKAIGTEENINDFLSLLKNRPPERAVILKLDISDLEEDVQTDGIFKIIESEKEEGEIFVSPDIAICPECKQELFDRNNRRYLHPFINCTSCGPRMTILDGMPYDRERTSMKDFPMCPECEYEYTHAETRRYDAQPVCCNKCGPRVYLLRTDGSMNLPVDVKKLDDSQKDAAAITQARRTISNGGIVAIKGIGGFHLCCDATDTEAVSRLRNLKRRPAKPFAVMMKDMETVHRECSISREQEQILDGHQKPIILLERKKYDKTNPDIQRNLLSDLVAPDNPKVGVMLPYAPLQLLIFQYDDNVQMPDCLVMTSANVSGAPICRNDADAVQELSGMCDLILSHNRLIRLRADDTVMDFYHDRPYMIRRSRGYAPLPFMVDRKCTGTVLAIGGELKNTFCIAKNHLFYPSAYIGDMADVRTVEVLKESVMRMEDLLEAEPQIVACDMHPKYNTTAVAESLGLPVLKVQHHYAHILSCMAENNYFDPVIGVAFDGTGYGTDQTIWGGEFLTADCSGFQRAGSIQPFLQLGGDASSKEGWRIAVSMLYGFLNDKEKTAETVQKLKLCDDKTLRVQFMMHDHHINSVVSTSAGRLFDAVSAVLGVRNSSSFEGEASTTLMFRALEWEKKNKNEGSFKCNRYSIKETENGFVLPTGQIFMYVTEQRLNGEDIRKLAWEFHKMLAFYTAEGCERIRNHTGQSTVALSGGVYQNGLLVQMTEEELKKRGFHVLLHSMIPPNDGGIALGQAVAAMHDLNNMK